MAKDFRAQQVRTNKIIGRSNGAVGGSGAKIQLALMKSGSADFAGTVTNPNPAGNRDGEDTGDLHQNLSKIGTDVWMVVDGGASYRYRRSAGESVLFLGDVVVSGTLYAERQQINITTTSLSSNKNNELILSGSVFVGQDYGMTVGKTVVIPDVGSGGDPGGGAADGSDEYTDPRVGLTNSAGASHNLAAQDSVFFTGEGTPQGLLVIRPNDNDGAANRGKIGIGVSDPDAKLEILSTGTQLRLSHNQADYATFSVADTGDLTIETVGDGSLDSDFIMNIDGNINLNADAGEVKIKDDSANHFFFDCNNTAFTIYDDQDEGDLFKIQIAQHGATTFTTVDDDAQAANLTMNIDGAIDINGHGAVTIDSSASTISIGADNVNQNINITPKPQNPAYVDNIIKLQFLYSNK